MISKINNSAFVFSIYIIFITLLYMNSNLKTKFGDTLQKNKIGNNYCRILICIRNEFKLQREKGR